MGILDSQQRVNEILKDLTLKEIHSNHPDDFEFYMMAFELVDSDDRVSDTFIFPINPDNISISQTNNVKISRTAGGLSVLNDNRFIPFDISLNGNFGRRLKLLLGRKKEVNAIGFYNSKEFDTNVKTGYGCCKILENILKKSRLSDSKGNPMRLFFYNLAFNTNYLVEFTNYSFSQNVSQNTIWSYSLSLKAIADVRDVREDNDKSFKTLLDASFLQKTGDSAVRFTNNLVNDAKLRIKANYDL